MSLEILHISDIHFGPPHLQQLSEAVVELASEGPPDLTVVSGDLTQRAKPEQFRAARRFVDRLPRPVLVVPGNHDVPLYRFWERFVVPFGAYRRHFDPELEPVVRTPDILAAGINTAHGWTFTEGRIRRARLRKVVALFDAAPEGVLKIAVAHHHLVPPPRFGPQDVSRNAFEAIDVLASAGVELVLSGHHHQSFIANSEEFYPLGRPPVVILHSGTTTSTRGRGSERDKNTCFWIRASETVLEISQLRWEPAICRFAEHSRHWYPRQSCSPYVLKVRSEPAARTRP